jgi:hypothetical protein
MKAWLRVQSRMPSQRCLSRSDWIMTLAKIALAQPDFHRAGPLVEPQA